MKKKVVISSVIIFVICVFIGGNYFKNHNKAVEGINIIKYEDIDKGINIHDFLKHDKIVMMEVSYNNGEPGTSEESYDLMVRDIRGYMFYPKYNGEYTLKFENGSIVYIHVIS